MCKYLLLSILLLYGSVASAQALRLERDSVKILNAELVIKNTTEDVPGYLYNMGNGRTQFRKLGKTIEFKVGTPGFPLAGDTAYQHPGLVNYFMKVIRNGLLQYRSSYEGVRIDEAAGKIIFYPALQSNEHIYIEALAGMDFTLDSTSGVPQEPPVPQRNLRLQAGAAANSNKTFTLRWATNAQTLHIGPRIVGLGASTLAGYGLASPNRLGDRILSWLSAHTYNYSWSNLAVPGSISRNILPLADGGEMGRNIEAALKQNPDFIFVSLPSNDPVNGITVLESIANLKKVDSLARVRGIPVFIETSQPRTAANTEQQTMLKEMADSIRAIWPDRYVEGFKPFADPSGIAKILPLYDNGDGVHLNAAGIQVLASNLFERWMEYFTAVKGVKRYTVDSSLDRTAWSPFYMEPDMNTVKKIFPHHNPGTHYYRVRAELADGSYTPYTEATLAETITSTGPDTSLFAYRMLIDLGGDGVTTLNGSNVADGWPTPVPDALGNFWNNWYGVGGIAGFAANARISNMITSRNEPTRMSMEFLTIPQGTFGTSATKSINYNGFTEAVGDYPREAVYDNVFFHNSRNPEGTILRIRGLSPANTYHIKAWGARLDNATGSRQLQAKVGGNEWTSALTMETRYAPADAPDYERCIWLTNISGQDSVDIVFRVATGSTFGHLSLLDIGVEGELPAIPHIQLRDTSTTLGTMQLTAVPANGASIATYQWSQIAGPNTAIIQHGGSATANISGLTNGIFVFRVAGISGGETLFKDVAVSVFPDNAGKKTLRMYFSKTPAASLPGWLNVHGEPHRNHIVSTDPATSWTVDNVAATTAYWTPFASLSASSIDGKTTGNNSGIIPDLALQGYWFNYYVGYTAGMENLLIKGLDPAKTYTLKLYASRASTVAAPRYGCWRVNGGTELLQNALDNTSQETLIQNVSPDSSGTIKINVNSPGQVNTYGAYSYLNALIVVEN